LKNILLILLYTSFHIGFTQDSTAVEDEAVTSETAIKVSFGMMTEIGRISIKVIKFVDSRCPSDVECVWAGEVIASVLIFKNGTFRQNQDIHINLVLNAENLLFEDNNQRLYIVSTSPYPKVSNGGIKQTDYIFNMVLKEI
jgi:hypothetical protein